MNIAHRVIRLSPAWGCAILALMMALMAPLPTSAQNAPDPRPDVIPFFYDANGIFDEGELGTLQRDAKLLQSSKVPTLVYVREVSAEQASTDTAQPFADEIRQSWGIESAEGADDGLVLLFSWVPDNPTSSTVVQSYGEATFAKSGLTPESIEQTIDSSVRSLLEQNRPFETMVYLMRETRYTGIYAPPPPPESGEMAQAAHDILDWLAPILVGITALAFGAISSRFWSRRPTSRQVWTIAGITLSMAVLLWLLAVQTRSDVGVASSLLIVVILTLATWLWTHAPFRTHNAGAATRKRSVPGTARRMRKQRQARVLKMRVAKVTR